MSNLQIMPMQIMNRSKLGFADFVQYINSNHLGNLYPYFTQFADELDEWLGIRDYQGKIIAITPTYDDSEDVPTGNRRVKPSHEIMFFAKDYLSARRLIDYWEELYPNSTRFCNIRIPLSREYMHLIEALEDSGYELECVSRGLFNIDGQRKDIGDYAKNVDGREDLFPERDFLIPALLGCVAKRRPYPKEKIQEMMEETTHNFREASPHDSPEITRLLLETFPVYGTYDLDEMVSNTLYNDSHHSKIYVAERDREITGTVTLEFHPFKFAEFTDVAVAGDTRGEKIAFLLGTYALRDAHKKYGLKSYYSDCVPHPAINCTMKRLGANLDGIHNTQVRLITQQLKDDIGRIPEELDLMVWSGELNGE